MTAAPNFPAPAPLEQILDQARLAIQVSKEELDEARARREQIAEALRREFPGSHVYVNGSVAHGDALTPLTDIDVGVIVADPAHRHGPGKGGPVPLMERAAGAIRAALWPAYPKLRVIVEGQKRAVLVRFGDPVDPSLDDFTADVIVALDNPTGEGLYIPRYDQWDRSHPQKHTDLVRAAVDSSAVMYSRVVRLLKHWARQHDGPMCSWHIKALALDCLAAPTTLLAGMVAWFDHAIAELSLRDTPDPAHVAGPIKLPEGTSRSEIVDVLTRARAQLAFAIELDAAGYEVLARDELAKFFNDEQMIPRQNAGSVTAQRLVRAAQRRRGPTASSSSLTAVPTTSTPASPSNLADRGRTQTRSWAP